MSSPLDGIFGDSSSSSSSSSSSGSTWEPDDSGGRERGDRGGIFNDFDGSSSSGSSNSSSSSSSSSSSLDGIFGSSGSSSSSTAPDEQSSGSSDSGTSSIGDVSFFEESVTHQDTSTDELVDTTDWDDDDAGEPLPDDGGRHGGTSPSSDDWDIDTDNEDSVYDDILPDEDSPLPDWLQPRATGPVEDMVEEETGEDISFEIVGFTDRLGDRSRFGGPGDVVDDVQDGDTSFDGGDVTEQVQEDITYVTENVTENITHVTEKVTPDLPDASDLSPDINVPTAGLVAIALGIVGASALAERGSQ